MTIEIKRRMANGSSGCTFKAYEATVTCLIV